MPLWIEILVSLCLILGSLFILIGAIGLYRLPDFFTRLHGPTKAPTLGVGGVILASMIFFSSQEPGLSVHELLITLFLFITKYKSKSYSFFVSTSSCPFIVTRWAEGSMCISSSLISVFPSKFFLRIRAFILALNSER